MSSNGGTRPAWTADDRELWYVEPGDKGVARLMMVGVKESGAVLEHVTPVRLFDLDDLIVNLQGRAYDPSKDGRRVIAVKDLPRATAANAALKIVVVQNWFEELKRRVSAR